MSEGQIDFIEPDTKEEHRKEDFEIISEDVSEVTKLVSQTAGEIARFDFWDKRCDDKACEYCALRNIIKD